MQSEQLNENRKFYKNTVSLELIDKLLHTFVLFAEAGRNSRHHFTNYVTFLDKWNRFQKRNLVYALCLPKCPLLS